MPSTPSKTLPLAARVGRWSTRHRAIAIGLWLAFVVAAIFAGSLTGTKESGSDGGTGQSARADRLVDDHFPEKTVESLLIQRRDGGPIRTATVRATTAELTDALRAAPGVTAIDDPFTGDVGTVSPDGRSALMRVDLRGDTEANEKRIDGIERKVQLVAAASPELRIGQFGDASADKAISKIFEDDFAKAEKLSLPITLLILVLVFGAFVAAGVPLLLAATAVAGTIGLLGPVSQLVPMDETVTSVVLLVGMAVGVDYSLFVIRREREERRRGHSAQDALAIASATSGRAVLTSGLTVMAAMAGLLFAGDPTFSSMGVGAMLVVAVAMLGSLTVLPAALSLLGDRIEKGRIPVLHRLLNRGSRRAPAAGAGVDGVDAAGADAAGGRGWDLILRPVLRRPLVAAIISGGALVALTIPAFSLHTATSSIDDIPRTIEVMKVYDRMQAAFPGGQIPAQVIVHADDVTAPAVTAQIADLKARALKSDRLQGPITVSVTPDKRVARVEVPVDGNGNDAASERSLDELRDRILPAVFPSSGEAEALVTGQTAGSRDFNDLMKSRAPIVFAFVLTLAFLLLLVTFRSIVIPLKAIVLNLLSVGASYGVLVWVFQDGHLESQLGFTSHGYITSWLPMFLFVILFGLSMDYHVFILSRIREAVDRGASTADAVSIGIRGTAGTVTSAALVMVAVFSIFATLSAVDFKQMGVGLATAILLDATIVRAVLLPASMSLLGERNWYLPSWLEWLPQVRAHDAVPTGLVDGPPRGGVDPVDAEDPDAARAARRERRALTRA
ncbi:Heme uptake protein MmpL11 [Paraconexibacter sp. AEG42_29]|uniref:Heme uptake protein MmpL11 n=1 Tax=Paraconexibacter sp. AEG42_29 TaxID=2997339 RepID=A0AAU7B2F6_9ACTN